ncbi:MAG: hypothetical protein IJ806_05985 [Ruminococcus sp.]|nr:hypothetical protein [Ruminococcus sp.]MBR1863617.1 hypothetical protein [Ruminococcus sp.]
MKKMKMISRLTAGLMTAGIMALQAMPVFADGDVVLDCKDAKESSNWSTSVDFSYASGAFDATRITENSIVKVDFEVIGDRAEGSADYPVELIIQSWSYPESTLVTPDGQVWGKVVPSVVEEGHEEFNWSDMIEGYGSDNFDKVDKIIFGSTNYGTVKVTGVTITNCADEGHHWIDPAILEQEEAAKQEKEANKKKNIVGIVVGIVAGIVAAIVAVFIFVTKKSSEAFDVSTGEFVDKKDAK